MVRRIVGVVALLGVTVLSGAPNIGKVNSGIFKKDRTFKLSLSNLISQTITRNYDLMAQRIKVDMAKHQVELEKGIYEPTLIVTGGYNKTKVPNTAEEALSRGYMEMYEENKRYFETSVGGLFSTGAKWKVSLYNQSRNSNLIAQTQDYPTEYNKKLSISIDQPLLKGFGKDVTNFKINLARTNKKIVIKEHNAKLMDLVGASIKLYWSLYGTQKLYEAWRESLYIAHQEYKTIQNLVEYGKLSNTALIDAQSAIVVRKSELLALEAKMIDLQNRILSLLNISAKSNTLLIASDRPKTKVKIPSLKYSYKKAVTNLPTFELAKLRVEEQKLRTKQSEDALNPDLTLSAGVSSYGLSDYNSVAQKDVFDDKYVSWNVSLNLSMPIMGNDRAKEALAVERLKLKTAQLDIESSKRSLYNVLDTKIKEFKIYKKQFGEYRQDMNLKNRLLKIEREKLLLGKTSMREVLRREEELMSSHRRLLNALVNLKLSEALLDKASGELLKKYNIKVDLSKKKKYFSNKDQLF
jgi:outer membrane protein TolC